MLIGMEFDHVSSLKVNEHPWNNDKTKAVTVQMKEF